MNHRLTIALVALAIFVLVAIAPVSAVKVISGPDYYYNVSQNIGPGSTVYIGEAHLNLVPAGLTDGMVLGYWAGGDRTTTPPTKTVLITSAADYPITAGDYGIGGSSGDWYVVDPNTGFGSDMAFRVWDPELDVNIWDPRIAANVNGQSVIMGEDLQFGIVTNQYGPIGFNTRTPVYGTSIGDGYIDLKVRTPSGAVLNQLYTDMFASSANASTLTSINVSSQPYYWGDAPLDAATGSSAGVPPFSWHTGASIAGQRVYTPGVYTVWAESLLNNMKANYLDGSGAIYTGKTVSQVKTITIVPKRSEVGVFRNSHDWYLDYNGNGTWDGNVIDRQYALGRVGDVPLVGDWNGNGITEIGVFRDNHTWNVDYNGNGVWDGISGGDRIYIMGKTGDKPVPGDWNGDNITEMAVFRDSHNWYIDYNGNGVWNGPAGGDRIYITGKPGDIPVPGDWNGDGITEMAVFRDSHNWYIDFNGNGVWDSPAGGDRIYTTGQPGDIPVQGDWNGDQLFEMGVFRPSNHNFYLDFNANGLWDGASVDNRFDFGTYGDIPVSGKW